MSNENRRAYLTFFKTENVHKNTNTMGFGDIRCNQQYAHSHNIAPIQVQSCTFLITMTYAPLQSKGSVLSQFAHTIRSPRETGIFGLYACRIRAFEYYVTTKLQIVPLAY